MGKLEQLFNSLIEKGWKPFGALGNVRNSVYTNKYFFFEGCADGVTLRQIVSRESGLWQFVCENGMIKNEKLTHTRISQVEWGLDVNCVRKTTSSKYDFRLLESALKDEPELESLILDNIKIEGKV